MEGEVGNEGGGPRFAAGGTASRWQSPQAGGTILRDPSSWRFLFAIQVQFVNIPMKGRTCPGSSRASSGRFPALGSVCEVSSGV